jgi:hypothetical protein
MQADQLMQPAPFKPLNPYGRAMPKVARASREPLYQLCVKVVDTGKLIRVGPMIGKDAAEQFLFTLNKTIAAGLEKQWAEPHLVLAKR